MEAVFTMEIEGAGVKVGRIFLYVEVVNLLILHVSIQILRNRILLLILSSCVKLRTELFSKVSCLMLISSVLFVRKRMLSTYLK